MISFGSGGKGVPGFIDPPQVLTVEPGKTKINRGLDSIIAWMLPGERRVVIVPTASGYGRAVLYPPVTSGKRSLVISRPTRCWSMTWRRQRTNELAIARSCVQAFRFQGTITGHSCDKMTTRPSGGSIDKHCGATEDLGGTSQTECEDSLP